MNNAVGKPVYSRWWLWLGVLVLLVALWKMADYAEWWRHMQPYWEHNRQTAEYYEYLDEKREAREEAYRKDTYGGETPEETLQLFVEALEAENYELASKYMIPEKQEETFDRMHEAVESGGAASLVDAYRNGNVVFTRINKDTYEADAIQQGQDVGFGFRFVLNAYTNKWKIAEL